MRYAALAISDELNAKLVRISLERGVAKSVIIREALESYLAGANGAKVTCGDLAGDLIGSLEGAADLATNPKHARGYGQ